MKKLTEDFMKEHMSAADVRAVAHDRGYDLGKGSGASAKSKFLELQDKDDRVDEELTSEEAAGQQPVSAKIESQQEEKVVVPVEGVKGSAVVMPPPSTESDSEAPIE